MTTLRPGSLLPIRVRANKDAKEGLACCSCRIVWDCSRTDNITTAKGRSYGFGIASELLLPPRTRAKRFFSAEAALSYDSGHTGCMANTIAHFSKTLSTV